MSVGPLRRSVGALGLVALAPLAAMVVLGTLDPVDAAIRALVTVTALLVLGRATGWGLRRLAASMEASGGDTQRADDAPGTPANPTATAEPAPES